MGLLDIMGFLKPDNLKSKAKSYIKEKYNRDIECDDISLGLQEVQFKNFRLSEEGGFENGVFLQAQNAFVKLDIISALSKNIDIKSLSFEDVCVVFIKQGNGKFNFSNFLSAKKENTDKTVSPSPDKKWNIKAGDISLVRGILTFKDIKSGCVICLKGISGSVKEFSFLTE